MLFKIGLYGGFLPYSFILIFYIQRKNCNSRRLYSLLAPGNVLDEQTLMGILQFYFGAAAVSR